MKFKHDHWKPHTVGIIVKLNNYNNIILKILRQNERKTVKI